MLYTNADYLSRYFDASLAKDYDVWLAQWPTGTPNLSKPPRECGIWQYANDGVVPGITTDALYSSATRQALVGGDFYTLIRLPDDRSVMILGDVSGKGVEAASMSALVKTALTAYAWEGASPVHMVRSLNSMLMSFSRVETFATMFVAKIDLRYRSALYCSAGHPPSMLVRSHTLGAGGEPRADGEEAGVGFGREEGNGCTDARGEAGHQSERKGEQECFHNSLVTRPTIAHTALLVKGGGANAPRPGERRTENRERSARQARDG